MTKIKAKDLVSLKKEELEKKLDELSMEIMKENTQVASGTSPKNPGKFRNAKKNVARIRTIIRAQENK